MTDQIIVRFKKGGMSRSGTPEEVMRAMCELLPFDKIYFVIPHPDGKGYNLREAGTVVLDIDPSVDIGQVSHAEPEVTPLVEPLAPSSPPSGSGLRVDQVSFVSEVETNSFKFDKPKTQSQLLKERGLEQPKPKQASKSTPTPTLPKARAKKGRGKAAKAVKVNLDSDDWDKDLPPPVRSGPAKVHINGFSIATPAEAAAASKFGKS